MASIYDELSIPKQCMLNKDIPRDLFLLHGKLTPKGIERFQKHFQSASLICSLKAENCPNWKRKEASTENSELQIIEITVNSNKGRYFEQLSFARDMMQAISYPILLVTKHGVSNYRFLLHVPNSDRRIHTSLWSEILNAAAGFGIRAGNFERLIERF